jgi:hypothetical protein
MNSFGVSDCSEDKLPPTFSDWIVGLDLFGEEMGHPYCPFVTDLFLRFIENAKRHNKLFGVRIHCAENVPFVAKERPAFRMFVMHLYICFRGILFLHERGVRMRLGHGVAFAPILNGDFEDTSGVAPALNGDFDDTSAVAPALNGDFNDTSGIAPALNGDFEDTSAVAPALNGDFDDTGAVAPALNGDFEDTSAVAPALNGDFNDTSAVAPALNGDFEDTSAVAPALNGDFDDTGAVKRKSDILLNEIKIIGERIFGTIPFEVNLTSNFYLLHNTQFHVSKHVNVENAAHILHFLFDKGIPVILSTDDDGIWPLDNCGKGHTQHISLPGEFCKGIQYKVLRNFEEIEGICETTKKYCFWSQGQEEDTDASSMKPPPSPDDGENIQREEGRKSRKEKEETDEGEDGKEVEKDEEGEEGNQPPSRVVFHSDIGKGIAAMGTASKAVRFFSSLYPESSVKESEASQRTKAAFTIYQALKGVPETAFLHCDSKMLELFRTTSQILHHVILKRGEDSVFAIFICEDVHHIFTSESFLETKLHRLLLALGSIGEIECNINAFCSSYTTAALNEIESLINESMSGHIKIFSQNSKMDFELRRNLSVPKKVTVSIDDYGSRQSVNGGEFKPNLYAVADHSGVSSAILEFLMDNFISDKQVTFHKGDSNKNDLFISYIPTPLKIYGLNESNIKQWVEKNNINDQLMKTIACVDDGIPEVPESLMYTLTPPEYINFHHRVMEKEILKSVDQSAIPEILLKSSELVLLYELLPKTFVELEEQDVVVKAKTQCLFPPIRLPEGNRYLVCRDVVHCGGPGAIKEITSFVDFMKTNRRDTILYSFIKNLWKHASNSEGYPEGRELCVRLLSTWFKNTERFFWRDVEPYWNKPFRCFQKSGLWEAFKLASQKNPKLAYPLVESVCDTSDCRLGNSYQYNNLSHDFKDQMRELITILEESTQPEAKRKAKALKNQLS